MGQYRLSIYFKWQIGFTISYERTQLLIRIPFFTIHIGISKHAKGFGFFIVQ